MSTSPSHVRPDDSVAACTEPEVVLHIGAPKTGSSALQLCLLRNRAALAAAGYYYPEHPVGRNLVSTGHGVIGFLLRSGKLAEAAERFQRFRAEAERSNLRLLLSAESLYVQAELLKPILDGHRVEVIGFYRDPLGALLSFYNQRVKRAAETASFSAFVDGMKAGYVKWLSGTPCLVWQDVYGKDAVRVYGYEPERFGGQGIAGKFLGILGIGDADLARFDLTNRIINRSYTASALELKRLLNCVVDRSEKGLNAQVDSRLQAVSELQGEPDLGLDALVDGDRLQRLHDLFGDSNKLMREQVLTECSDQFLRYDSASEGRAGSGIKATPRYSLAAVAEQAFGADDELLGQLRARVSRHAREPSRCCRIQRLAEILGVADSS